MSSRCRKLRELQGWSRLGSDAPLPSTLSDHAVGCATCGELLAQIIETRELGSCLPKVDIDPGQLDAIRFTLLAGARRAEGAHRARTSPSRSWRHVALAAGAFVLVIGLVIAWGTRTGPKGVATAVFADVHLAPGAVGKLLRSGPDAVFALSEGSAAFVVPRLGPGQRYRVVVRSDVVEVRGTEFQVVAGTRGLDAARVRKGRVRVSVAGRLVAELGPGDTWQRPRELREASAVRIAQDSAAAPNATRATSRAVLAEGKRSGEISTQGRWTTAARPSDERARAPTSASDGQTSAETASNAVPPRVPSPPFSDDAFRRAWQLFQGGKYGQAAQAFKGLSQAPGIDPGRRADLLYWSGRAYELDGDWNGARAQAEALLEESPGAWHAPNAALLAAEALLLQGDYAGARRTLGRARASDRASVRERAAELARRLDEATGQPAKKHTDPGHPMPATTSSRTGPAH